MKSEVRHRCSGRDAKLAQRSVPTNTNPAPPGQPGGRYKPLTETNLVQIYQTALRLLDELGMSEVPERLERDLIAADGRVTATGRLSLITAMVEQASASSAKTFILHGRDPDRSIEVGGDLVSFGTGGAAVNALDLDTNLYRPSTLADLHDFTRLQDTLANVA